MKHTAVFSYGLGSGTVSGTLTLPYLPIVLERGGKQMGVTALVDSGASLKVLPYHVGLQLGAIWEQQTTVLQLGGNLARSEARALLLDATVERFPTVRLAFAWSQDAHVPVILGQTNFFMEFDVCFLRSLSRFEIKSKSS